jgi:hypothetical protein
MPLRDLSYDSPGLKAYLFGPNAFQIGIVRAPGTNTEYLFDFIHGSFGDLGSQKQTEVHVLLRRELAEKRVWTHVLNPLAKTDVDTLTETVDATLDFIEKYGPQCLSLNYVLHQFVQAEHLAAMLRASSSWRADIAGWSDALRSAVRVVESTGADPKDVLFGMV